ncbi:MAG: methionine--tRNA ligase [Patescibacteria group bacterium]|nr:MAG: methionine--tRNA ligase [Patescibacteria group bacterium]
MTKPFYVTAAIPYVNAAPHIGHALEFVQVDVIARFHRLLGKKTIALTGSDENALKNVQAAQIAGIPTKEFVDKNAEKFLELLKKLNTSFDVFQKSTNQNHIKSSQDLWNRCLKDIYKKTYQGLYCLGCEAFYTEDELVNGECVEHPGKKLEIVQEENYFFKLSKYQNQLIDIIKNDKIKIYPEFRKNEVLSFLKQPLQDISISRSNKRAKNWGIPVPNDPDQRMYVWFDALNVYRSGVADDIWPADLHVIGKGIIRFHAVYWPAFLLSANLPLPKAILVHGYFTVNGQKMSKTLGNIIDPFSVIEKYGADALRYYLLKEISPFNDGDFSFKRLNEVYNSDLANELGNLVSRLTNLAEKDNLTIKINENFQFDNSIIDLFNNFQFNLIIEEIWKKIKILNKKIDDFAPWKKTETERKDFLIEVFQELIKIAKELQPFLPETADKILKSCQGKIKKIPPLFPKIKI